MKNKKYFLLIFLGILTVLLVDYFGYVNLFAMMSVKDGIGMPNPSSAYCIEMGGKPVNDMCHFPDGSECELWAFFRGECKPGGPNPTICMVPEDCDVLKKCNVKCVPLSGTRTNYCRVYPTEVPTMKYCGSSFAMCIIDPCAKWLDWPDCRWDRSGCDKDPECVTHSDCVVEKSCVKRMCVDGKCESPIMPEYVPPRPCAKFIGYPDCKWDYSGCERPCLADIKECADGSIVKRDANNDCQFPKCPVIDDDIKPILEEIKREQVKQTSLLQKIIDWLAKIFGGQS